MTHADLHLDNDGLWRASYGPPDAGEAEHLAGCAACAAAVAAWSAHRSRVASGNPIEQLPEAFWQRERQAILAAARQPKPALRGRVVALSLATLLALAALLVSVAPQAPPRRPAPAARATEDDKLLRDIYVMVNRTEPRALAPMALLLSDRAREARRP